MNKRKIEIFTAGCPVCNPVVDMVKSFASENDNEVIIYNLVEQGDNDEFVDKVKQYGVQRLPAVAVDGALLSCCKNKGITKEDLITAGVC